MKFGIMLPHSHQAASTSGIIRVAQEAEALGFDSLWANDHIAVPKADSHFLEGTYFEPMTVLGFAAGLTKHIRLGTGVIVMPYHHPMAMAKFVATLDVLSSGRAMFGVGTGWAEDEFRAVNAKFADRGRWTDESLRLMKHVWANPEPSFQGEFFQVENVICSPTPIQQPHPPIWLGGGLGPKSMRRVAEFANGWLPVQATPERFRQGRELLQEPLAEFGRDKDSVEFGIYHPLKFTDEPRGPNPNRPLIGTEAEIITSLEKFRDAGATYAVLVLYFMTSQVRNETADTMLKTMDHFANRVMPLFSE